MQMSAKQACLNFAECSQPSQREKGLGESGGALFKGKEGRGDFRKNCFFYLRNKFSSMSNNPYRIITLALSSPCPPDNQKALSSSLSFQKAKILFTLLLFYPFTFKSLIVCVLPVMPVTTAIPLSRISTFSYLASTITFPFNVITPQCWGICSKAQ